MNEGIQRAIDVFGSQAAMARALGVKQPTISEWRRGARPVPAERCPQIEGETARLGQRVYCEDLRDDVQWGVLRQGCCRDEAGGGADGGSGGPADGEHGEGGTGAGDTGPARHWPFALEGHLSERRVADRRVAERRHGDRRAPARAGGAGDERRPAGAGEARA
jgi:DNA-binding transcriptional regulator YdaS (Cro superfamily)